jgi:predicted RNA-binding Zn ribbon-like protein
MDAEIWLELLNSDWHDYRGTGKHEDRLDNPSWVKEFLERWGIDLDGIAGDKVTAALRSLRAVILRFAKQAAKGKTTERQLFNQLNSLLVQSPLVRRLVLEAGQPKLTFIPVAGKLESALGVIAGSFAEALARGSPSRIKICNNKDCLWVFYDRSKNKSRKWCEGAGCGNLMKVRRFRERHRKKAAEKG